MSKKSSGRRKDEGRLSSTLTLMLDRGERLRDRALGSSSLWLVIFLIASTWALMPRGSDDAVNLELISPGRLADRDYVAPEDFPVEDVETTAAKRVKAREDVLPVYDLDSAATQEIDERVGLLFEEGRRLITEAPEELQEDASMDEEVLAQLRSYSGMRLTPEGIEQLTEKSFTPELEDRVRGILREVMERGVVASVSQLLENRLRGVTLRDLRTGEERRHIDLYDHLGYPDDVRDLLRAETRRWPGFNAAQRRVVETWMLDNVAPNLSPSPSSTLELQEAAAQAAEPVFIQIRKGQVIARRGDVLTETTARAIRTLADAQRAPNLVPPLLGTALFLLLAALTLWLSLRQDGLAGRRRERVFNEGLLLLSIGVVGLRLCLVIIEGLTRTLDTPPFNSVDSWIYALPFAALALVARLVCGRAPAVMLSVIFSVLVSRALEAGPGASAVLVYCLGGCFAALFLLDAYPVKQRMVLIRAGALVGLANAVLILVIRSLTTGAETDPATLGFEVLCGLVGGLLVAGVASFAVPILESLLSVTTDIKLVELANTNLPLLRRLAFEAPGSFQHSLMVANLAKAGCDAIGADSVLAYTGGLYHDIGKVQRPEYFIENQRGVNPHDKLKPSMSSLILVSHVKDGLEMARDYALPQPLRDAIAQHHGTRRINFFYNRALELAGEEGRVDEMDYRYPGPRPQNKVQGVLMLADGVEAAGRTLTDPSPHTIREMVKKIVDHCLQDGQLDETDLTLGDIAKVVDSFVDILSSIYHRRIDYPGFEFNKKGAQGGEGKGANGKNGRARGEGRGREKQVAAVLETLADEPGDDGQRDATPAA
ncbi:MAG: HDIG domain-containing metalloprotein [Acidobacteriota bacterium]